MESKIPKHHVKQQICATRPAYREGRIPKAVKVYTINNESKYILIQGVPSVGATKELIQLCSSYGEIEEHHALDEYPCEDKYTEVYLVKYKKIQSARFAKRKLDEYSFFGGSLHVCYAPEYETVADTREKLQERRRAVAAKIRHHKNECSEDKPLEQVMHTEETLMTATSSSQSFDPVDRKSSDESFLSTGFQHSAKNDVSSQGSYLSQSQPESCHALSNVERGNGSPDLSSQSYTFILPPPPKPSINKQIAPKLDYEYSRVPSKHSTLPAGFDGRLQQHGNQQQKLPQPIPDSQPSHQNDTTASKETSSIVRKDFKPSKPALKFVPRQAVKRSAVESAHGSKNGISDDVDKEIRKNAFLLTDHQGPADLPGRRNDVPLLAPGTSSSYINTIKTIRNKISKVITDAVKLQK